MRTTCFSPGSVIRRIEYNLVRQSRNESVRLQASNEQDGFRAGLFRFTDRTSERSASFSGRSNRRFKVCVRRKWTGAEEPPITGLGTTVPVQQGGQWPLCPAASIFGKGDGLLRFDAGELGFRFLCFIKPSLPSALRLKPPVSLRSLPVRVSRTM